MDPRENIEDVQENVEEDDEGMGPSIPNEYAEPSMFEYYYVDISELRTLRRTVTNNVEEPIPNLPLEVSIDDPATICTHIHKISGIPSMLEYVDISELQALRRTVTNNVEEPIPNLPLEVTIDDPATICTHIHTISGVPSKPLFNKDIKVNHYNCETVTAVKYEGFDGLCYGFPRSEHRKRHRSRTPVGTSSAERYCTCRRSHERSRRTFSRSPSSPPRREYDFLQYKRKRRRSRSRRSASSHGGRHRSRSPRRSRKSRSRTVSLSRTPRRSRSASRGRYTPVCTRLR